jgi:hypothetical protein
VRANTCSFANLAHADEVQEGLVRLAADIRSGELAAIGHVRDTGEGDYAFIIAHAHG